MALKIKLAVGSEERGYIPFLQEELDRRSPALRERDVWGFRTLRDVFKVDMHKLISQAGDPRHPKALASHLEQVSEAESGSLLPEIIIAGAGFSFDCVPEPYRTEIKAVLSLWLAEPHMHKLARMRKHGWIIPFASNLAQSAMSKELLADYGIDQLRSLFASWTVTQGRIPAGITKTSYAKRDATGNSQIFDLEYIEHRHPAARLARTLDAQRERHKPMSQRDLILHSDLFPNDPSRNSVFVCYTGYDMRVFRVPFIREATRAYLLHRVKYGKITSKDGLQNSISFIKHFEECLLEFFGQPTFADITKEFYEETFARKCALCSTYVQRFTNVGAFLNWASQSSLQGWHPIHVDNSSRLLRAYRTDQNANDISHEYNGRMMPEEVVDQIFTAIQSNAMPEKLKRLFIIVRYTGMRGADLHSLQIDCLQDDPHDPEFALLRFYQSKVKQWNTKPLKKSEPAHKMVIETILAQQITARKIVEPLGREPRFLFPTVVGLAESHSHQSNTRNGMRRWTIEQKCMNPDGTPYCFKGWHSLRHLLGTEMALAGHELHVIMMELGHKSPEMSMRYMNRRLDLKKKALLEKGAGRYIDIEGRVDVAIGDLIVRKEALTVDVPGGMCGMPGQIGEWCEHNRACFTCIYFRADIEQLPFFERERYAVTATKTRLQGEVAEFEAAGKARMAEIGKARLARNEQMLTNLVTIAEAIKSNGSYRGTERKAQGARGCGTGPECPSTTRR